MKKSLFVAAGLAAWATIAPAAEYDGAMKRYLENHVMAWVQAPVILDAIAAQNAVTSGYDAARIGELDQAWQAEIGTSDTPIISAVIGNSAADFLREQVMASGGAITEVFVMDSVGLNVAASDITSDYWQGDEAKFQKTYGAGPNAVHFGEIEFDESSQQYQAQISVSITDPETGALIGAMTIGVNADQLM